MNRTSLALVVTASVLAVGLPRWFVRSTVPYNWDAATFAMAVEDIDLEQHRPHPPPAVGLVLTARLLQPLVGGDPHAALILENSVFSVLSCTLIFALAFGARSAGSATRAWLAWLVFATSVQHAFNTSVAEVYMAELTTTLLVAWLGWRALAGSSSALVGMAIALGIAGAFRLTGMVFMSPLAAWVVWRAPCGGWAKRAAGAAFVLSVLSWLVPLLAVAGFDSVIGLTVRQLTSVSEVTSLAASDPLRNFNRNLRDVVYALVTGVGVFNVVALPIVQASYRPSRLSGLSLKFGLLWLLPALSFFVFVHMGKMGYTLVLLPLGALVVARTYAAAGTAVRWLLVAGQIATGALHFLLGAPPSGAAIGEGLPYRDKTLVQQVLTESRAALSTTVPVLRQAERELQDVRATVARVCPPGRPPVLVAADGEGMNWRRAMQAFPELVAVRLPVPEDGQVFVARDGVFEIRPAGEVRFSGACAIVWLAPVAPSRGNTSGQVDQAWPFILRAPVRVALGSESVITLAGP